MKLLLFSGALIVHWLHLLLISQELNIKLMYIREVKIRRTPRFDWCCECNRSINFSKVCLWTSKILWILRRDNIVLK